MRGEAVSLIFQWVRDVFIVIISLSFFRILMPDGAMSKYLNFIFSMIILAVILAPVSKYI